MAKKKLKNAVNIEGAGKGSVDTAMESSTGATTQTTLEEVQEATEDAVEEAKSSVDEDNWNEIVERAQETETAHEQQMESRADHFQNGGSEALPGDDEPSEGSGEPGVGGFTEDGPDQQTFARESPVNRADKMVHGEEGPTEENLPRWAEERIREQDNFNVTSEVYAKVKDTSPVGENWDKGVSMPLEDQHFEDAQAVVNGEEAIEMPEDRLIDHEAFSDLANDDVEGIDFDDISPPDSPEGGDNLGDQAGKSSFEMFEEMVSQQAELELLSQKAVERKAAGQELGIWSKEKIAEKDFSADRPWKNQNQGPASGPDRIFKFVEERSGQADSVQSPQFVKRLANAQPGSKTSPEIVDGEVVYQNTAEDRADLDENETLFGHISDGNTVFDESVEKHPGVKQLSPEDHEYLGDKSTENLRKAGFRKVTDLAGADVEDLTQVDLVGPAKAEKLLEHEGAVADRFKSQAQKLNETIPSDEFNENEYMRILEYGAEKGVSPEKTAEVLRSPAVKREIPGPTPVSELDPEFDNSRYDKSHRQFVAGGHETEDAKSYSPNHGEYHTQEPIKVKGVVADTYEPNNPGEQRQVVELYDHEGNRTTFTVYKDSIHFPDSGDTTTGGWRPEETDPTSGIDSDIELTPGDKITIERPQINTYQGGNSRADFDGPALATTPSTSIEIEDGGTSEADNISRGEPSRSAPGRDPRKVDHDKSRALRRREQQYRKEHGTSNNREMTEDEELEDRDVDTNFS